jgi:hypothetical protein
MADNLRAVRHEQDCGAAIGMAAEQIKQTVLSAPVEFARRLIGEDDLRVIGKRDREASSRVFSPREL